MDRSCGGGYGGEGGGRRSGPAAFRALIRAPRDPGVCASSLTAAPGDAPTTRTPDRRRSTRRPAAASTPTRRSTRSRRRSAPSSRARVVHSETPHILVSGEHAVDLADEFGVETGVDLLTDEKRERYAAEDPPGGGPREHLDWLATRFGSGDDQAGGASEKDTAPDHDTVGAVATDGETFAAATSTGGRSFALAGRVGDVPQVGSGFFCTEAGGASATGAGEDIARVTLSRRAVGYLDDGVGAQAAAERAIDEFEEITGSGAGVIVLGTEEAGSAFNTDGMQTSIAYK